MCIGESLDAARTRDDRRRSRPGIIFFTAGVHPHDAAASTPPAIPSDQRIRTRAARVAIGECGLDYHYDHSPREGQRRAFAAQLRSHRSGPSRRRAHA